jgi:hypothetical protein
MSEIISKSKMKSLEEEYPVVEFPN